MLEKEHDRAQSWFIQLGYSSLLQPLRFARGKCKIALIQNEQKMRNVNPVTVLMVCRVAICYYHELA